ncbi:MAG TPA: class I SAM-dependent methyltransferase [Bacteroidales bacterium]|nr:class I SAM-dependent methyltransferase [Bacteroidales bacterium]
MNDDNNTIHEFDFNLICEYFSDLERQGPGSPEITRKALSFTSGLTDKSHICDIGCGTGGQTITLAQNTSGEITGIDLFPGFIELFNLNARKLNLHQRLKGLIGSMEDLPFSDEELDLIWSEGAIYFMGFERGLKEWRRFLKKGGYIAVSEASWFTNERPYELNRFWENTYPGIDTIPNKVAQMQNAGYVPIANFILPETCWTDNFYALQVKAQERFLDKHKGNKTAEEFIAMERYEMELYYKYKEFYGYAFYIGQKKD